MHQIKFFKGVENDLSALEREINAWLAESDARIIQTFGNIAPQSIPPTAKGSGLSTSEFAPSDILVAIVYDKLT